MGSATVHADMLPHAHTHAYIQTHHNNHERYYLSRTLTLARCCLSNNKISLQHHPQIRPTSDADLRSTRRLSARVCLYVTLINNTVDVVYFSDLCTVYFTHGRHGGVELQLRDGDGSWPKTPHESSSFLVRCRTPSNGE